MKKGFILLASIAAITIILTVFTVMASANNQPPPDGDETPPNTTKTYGSPSMPGLFNVPSCASDGTPTNVHFISTGTEITLTATDTGEDASGVNATYYSVLVPVGCDEGDEVEYIGQVDHNLYQDSEECALAVDNPLTNETETQQCVDTTWELKTEIMGQNYSLLYERPFVIPQESVHKICYYSVDNQGNYERIQCQIAIVDDTPPVINSVEVDREIIDLKNYDGNGAYFYDPKCTQFTVNATDTHEVEVGINVGAALRQMFQNIAEVSGFNQTNYEDYLAEHSMQEAELDDGLYRYWFCPMTHITDLLDYEVLPSDDSYSEFSQFLSEKLVLDEFEVPVIANDTAGKIVSTLVNLTIVDLTVPLEVGWNLMSTPIALEGDKFWGTDDIDAVLRFDSATQTWVLVTDNSMEPLDALYIHATNRNQYGIIFERDLTSPPLRTLHKGWNLYGATVQLEDYWYWPEDNYCSYDYYEPSNCYLTWLEEGYIANWDRCIGDALGPAIYTDDGNRGVGAVIAPRRYLSYDDDRGQWYFQQANQGTWVWIPEIEQPGATPDNNCDRDVKNFGGYWVFMENNDTVPGFTTTPLQINGDD